MHPIQRAKSSKGARLRERVKVVNDEIDTRQCEKKKKRVRRQIRGKSSRRLRPTGRKESRGLPWDRDTNERDAGITLEGGLISGVRHEEVRSRQSKKSMVTTDNKSALILFSKLPTGKPNRAAGRNRLRAPGVWREIVSQKKNISKKSSKKKRWGSGRGGNTASVSGLGTTESTCGGQGTLDLCIGAKGSGKEGHLRRPKKKTQPKKRRGEIDGLKYFDHEREGCPRWPECSNPGSRIREKGLD